MATQSTTEILTTLKDTVAPTLMGVWEATTEKLSPDAAKEQAQALVQAAAGEPVESGPRRWPWLLAGVALAAGAAAALLLRRRRTEDVDEGWPEYRPEPEEIDLTEQAGRNGSTAANDPSEPVTEG